MSKAVDKITSESAPEKRRRPMGWILFGVLAVVIGAGAWWWGAHGTYHFAEVAPGVLYRDGNHDLRQFSQTVDRVHPRTVVCLVDDKEMSSAQKPQFAQEAAFLKENGIRMEHIPIRLGGWPSDQQLQQFLETVSNKENQPVLVHCAQGIRRTGMMIAAYQMSIQHYDKQKAKDAILSFGHSQKTTDEIRRFIDEYDPATQTLSAALRAATTQKSGRKQ